MSQRWNETRRWDLLLSILCPSQLWLLAESGLIFYTKVELWQLERLVENRIEEDNDRWFLGTFCHGVEKCHHMSWYTLLEIARCHLSLYLLNLDYSTSPFIQICCIPSFFGVPNCVRTACDSQWPRWTNILLLAHDRHHRPEIQVLQDMKSMITHASRTDKSTVCILMVAKHY